MKARVRMMVPSRARHSCVESTKIDVCPSGDGQPRTSSGLPLVTSSGRPSRSVSLNCGGASSDSLSTV